MLHDANALVINYISEIVYTVALKACMWRVLPTSVNACRVDPLRVVNCS